MGSKGYISSSLARTLIDTLLVPCRPSAVRRCIRTIYVDAINGRFWKWFPSHVGQKQLKTLFPSTTHANAATAIVMVIGAILVRATLAHIDPRDVFSREMSAIGVAVNVAAFSRYIGQEASTTTSVAASQQLSINAACLAAFASTNPLRFCRSNRRTRQDSQASETQASYINQLWHRRLSYYIWLRMGI